MILISALKICIILLIELVLVLVLCLIVFSLSLSMCAGGPRARPVRRGQYSVVFVLLFAASDADSSSAVAFCLSWNSFVDSTGFFLNLCLYSA